MVNDVHLQPVIRPVDLNIDAQNLSNLARDNFDAAWSGEYLFWKYRQPPAGSAFAHYAEVNGAPAGLYADVPVYLKVDGQVRLGVQAVDGMVAADQRRTGLFQKIARRNYDLMDRAGIVLGYGFPNPLSLAAMTKKQDWIHVGNVPRFIRWTEYSITGSIKDAMKAGVSQGIHRVLSLSQARPYRTDGGVAVRTVQAFDERTDGLWQRVSDGLQIAVWRDCAYLDWRYVKNPWRCYIILTAERGQELVGYAVLSLKELHTEHRATLVELIVKPGDEAAGLALLREVNRQARESGCQQVHAWMLPQHQFYIRLLKNSGFVYWDHRVAPAAYRYAAPFIIRPHPDLKLEPDPTRIENWFLSAGDQDYF